MMPKAVHQCAVAVLILGLVACSGRNAVEFDRLTAGGGAAGASSQPNHGGGSGGSGGTANGSAGSNNGGLAGAVDGAAGASGAPCADQPKGHLIAHHSPPDCRSDVCDGQGAVISADDPTQLPPSDNPCEVGTCASDGPHLLPQPAATTCMTSDGGTQCDGAGRCVQCLVSKECAGAQTCVANRCVASASCTDQLKDGTETDIDCGGVACAPCPVGAQCNDDQDCASDTCHPLLKTCSAATCIDETQDGSETDVDCGGACRGCIPGQKCNANSDCASQKCDSALHVCGGTTCNDKLEDGDESDVDCGGLGCAGCLKGQKCNSPFDCAVGGCDPNVIPHVCD
jgi:hypothetical protein